MTVDTTHLNGILAVKRMRERATTELYGIPRGSFEQNSLRAVYWQVRTNSLGKRAEKVLSKEGALIESTKIMQVDNPDFVPRFRDTMFDIDTLCSLAENDTDFNSDCFQRIKETEGK